MSHPTSPLPPGRLSVAQLRSLQQRLVVGERGTRNLCQRLSHVTSQHVSVAEKVQRVISTLQQVSEHEAQNRNLQHQLSSITDVMGVMEEGRVEMAHGIEAGVILPLHHSTSRYRQVRESMKQTYTSQVQADKLQARLERVRERYPQDLHQILHLETDVERLNAEVSRCAAHTRSSVQALERERVELIKAGLHKFVLAQMEFDCRSLNLLTKIYSHIADINTDDDGEETKQFKASVVPSLASTGESVTGISTDTAITPLTNPRSSLSLPYNCLINATDQHMKKKDIIKLNDQAKWIKNEPVSRVAQKNNSNIHAVSFNL